ncbi:acyl carrier protein [Streptomyces sp. TRM66268-LWL]|uniref:Acyl carrier protein n=1 Tax=Streptomyces polyasparticus TaxID=2767826 RepID=A0ABR7SNH8_9ACTN|nr:acyl carrier protein [Streptomyces polyasparticus]MBC9716066.1 acyl carrier protein [Streptomyces polyasparticus]
MSVTTVESVREGLAGILGSIKKRDVSAELAQDENFMRALNLDSLDAVELTVRLGTDYGVEFGAEAEDLDALESFSALVDLVVRRATR